MQPKQVDVVQGRLAYQLVSSLGWHVAKRPAEVLSVVRDVVSRRTRELHTGAA